MDKGRKQSWTQGRRGLRLITATVKNNKIMWLARVSVRDMMVL